MVTSVSVTAGAASRRRASPFAAASPPSAIVPSVGLLPLFSNLAACEGVATRGPVPSDVKGP